MTPDHAELAVLSLCLAVAFACFGVVFALDTAAAFHPWAPW